MKSHQTWYKKTSDVNFLRHEYEIITVCPRFGIKYEGWFEFGCGAWILAKIQTPGVFIFRVLNRCW
jgi:hypothetical protein